MSLARAEALPSARLAAAAAAVVAAVFIALGSLPAWRLIELTGFDFLTVRTAPNDSTYPVTIVGIDEESVAAIGEQLPWRREIYALLIDALHAEGAHVIALDLVFDLPDQGGAEQDARLAAAISRSGNVILAADRIYTESAHLRQWLRVDPLPLFREAGAVPGYARLELDPDLVARRMPREDDALWRQIARGLAKREPAVGWSDVPPDAMIRYAGGFKTFQYVPFHLALEPKRLPPGFFKDQVVIVCRHVAASPDARAAQADSFVTPFTRSTGLFTPGGEIHGHVLETALRGDAIVPLGFAWHALLVLGTVVGAGWGMRRWRPLSSAAVAAGTIILIAAVDWLLFTRLDLWLPAAAAMAAVATLYATYGGLAFVVERKRKAELRRAFALYVSAEVVDHVMAHPERLALGGERRDVTMMFTDLAGFTTITEQHDAEQVASILNQHFSRGTAIIKRHGGTVNRFIGDAIMAMWGAPLQDPRQALHAMQAACEMQEDMARLRVELGQQGLPPIWMRIGMHSCNAIVGNLGSAERFDYTAIGDGVNLAARLEGVNKLYGTGILTSGETAAKLHGELGMRIIDRVIVKGKSEPVDLYTPCADAEAIDWSAKAMAAYRERRWAQSEEAWRKVLERLPLDGVAKLHLERLAALRLLPATAAWRDAVELEKL